MAQIGAATLVVKADSVALEAGLRRAGDKVNQFADGAGKKIEGRLGGAGRLGRTLGVDTGRLFGTMTSDANGLSKAVEGVNLGLAEMSIVLGRAMRNMTALQAVGVGAGLALASFGVAMFAEKMKEADAFSRKGSITLSEETKLALTAAAGGRAVEARGAGADTGISWLPGTGGPAVAFSAAAVKAATLTEEVRGIAKALGEVVAAAGRTKEEMSLIDASRGLRALRGEVVGLYGDLTRATDAMAAAPGMGTARDAGAAGRAFLASFRVFSELRAALPSAVAMSERAAGADRITGLEAGRTGARDTAATLGLSPEEAEFYRRSLRRITTEIGGITVASTASMSPLDGLAHRLSEISAMERRAGVAMPDARAEALRAYRAEVIELDRLRVELARVAGARETLAARTPFEAYLTDAGRLSSLLDAGAISAETFSRRITALAGATDPLVELGSRASILADGFARGAISATDAGRSLRNMLGVAQMPLEQLHDRMEAINTVALRTAGIAGGPELARTARAQALLGLSSAIRLELPPGVEAAQFGSVEAVRAINAASRAGPTDPVERTLEALRIQTEIERQNRDATERVARALEDGVFAAFIP